MSKEIRDGIYYEHGKPKHAGVVKVKGEIYYAGSDGVLAVGEKIVHSGMSNGILKHGTYRFDEDGKLVKDFYIAPKKQKKNKEDRKKGKKGISKKLKIAILCATAALILFIGADLFFGWTAKKLPSPEEVSDPLNSESPKSITLPAFEDEVYLCSEQLQRYYRGEITSEKLFAQSRDPYEPFVFRYNLSDDVDAILHLNGRDIQLDPDATFVTVDNLMTGKTYSYSVSVTERNGEDERTSVQRGEFTTADTNRFILIPGVSNVRDIGHYHTKDGKRIKEGLIIRGSEIDGLVEGKYFLTDKASAESFGFRLDMDLRDEDIYSGNYKSRLGDGVRHRFYNSPSYSGIFSSSGKIFLKDIFSEFAEPENYPIYMHCTYGADRTGTVVYLLQGLLGVSEEDMEFEYRLSAFERSSCTNNASLNGIIGGLEGMEGDTINEKIYSFMIQVVGLTPEQIDAIRVILLED